MKLHINMKTIRRIKLEVIKRINLRQGLQLRGRVYTDWVVVENQKKMWFVFINLMRSVFILVFLKRSLACIVLLPQEFPLKL